MRGKKTKYDTLDLSRLLGRTNSQDTSVIETDNQKRQGRQAEWAGFTAPVVAQADKTPARPAIRIHLSKNK